MGLGQSEISNTERVINSSDCQDIELRAHKVLKISSHVTVVKLEIVRRFLFNNENVFAWKIKDMKGILACYGEHCIDLMDDAVPVRQRQYCLNPKYSLLVKDKINKYLNAYIRC